MAELTDAARTFLSEGTRTGKLCERNGVPGEWAIRLRPTRVIAALDVTAES